MVEEDAALKTVSSPARRLGVIRAHELEVNTGGVDINLADFRVMNRQIVVRKASDLTSKEGCQCFFSLRERFRIFDVLVILGWEADVL